MTSDELRLNDDELRAFCLVEHHMILRFQLSDQQRECALLIAKANGWLAASDITARMGISPQHTSNLCKSLHSMGYVVRVKAVSPSGGHEYHYKLWSEVDIPKSASTDHDGQPK